MVIFPLNNVHRGWKSGSLVVHRLPKVEPEYQICSSGGQMDYHKIQEYFHICKLIFDNGLPDISEDYKIIQPVSSADYKYFLSCFYPSNTIPVHNF